MRLKNLGFSHVSARPKAYKQNAEAMDAFKKNSPSVAQIRAQLAPDTPVEVWFQDEMRVGQIPSPGMPPKLKPMHKALLARIVEEGPIAAIY
jgi:hypothetical protein